MWVGSELLRVAARITRIFPRGWYTGGEPYGFDYMYRLIDLDDFKVHEVHVPNLQDRGLRLYNCDECPRQLRCALLGEKGILDAEAG